MKAAIALPSDYRVQNVARKMVYQLSQHGDIKFFGSLLPAMPVALLPCVLRTFFSSHQLNEMGIRLEESEVADYVLGVHVPSAPYCSCM